MAGRKGAATRLHLISWRSGLVEIVRGRGTGGAIPLFRFASDEAAQVASEIMDALCRHSRERMGERIITGVPEAEDDEAAFTALLRFCRQLRGRFEDQLPEGSYRYLGRHS